MGAVGCQPFRKTLEISTYLGLFAREDECVDGQLVPDDELVRRAERVVAAAHDTSTDARPAIDGFAVAVEKVGELPRIRSVVEANVDDVC